MRNNTWLEQKKDAVWKCYFSDIKQLNEIRIKFGTKAKRRLGSIRQDNPRDKSSATKILITGYFVDEKVPEEIIEAVIAHELCHYAHGFASPHPQLSNYPHQGGLVDKELKIRGLGEHLRFQKRWLKEEWPKIVGTTTTRRRARRRIIHRQLELTRIIKLLGF